MESYFSGIWKDQNFESLEYSGYQLVDYVNAQKPNSVLDIGCGYNNFKGKIHKLIGVDPYNSSADIKLPLEELSTTMKFDIVLALGSINFGDESVIDNQMGIIDKLFRKEAIFSVHRGIPHDWADYRDIVWYSCTKEKINNIASRFNYTVKCIETEHVKQGHKRLFFVYAK